MTKTNKVKKTYLFGRLLHFLAPYKKGLVLSLLGQLLLAGLDVLPIILIGKVLDSLPSAQKLDFSQIITPLHFVTINANYTKLIMIFVAYAMVILMLGIVSYWKSLWLETTGQKVILELRKKIFKHIEALDDEELHKLPVGKLVTRTINDTNSLSYLFSYLLVDFAYTITVLIFYLCAMFITSWYVSLFLLIFIVITALSLLIFRMVAKKKYLKFKEENAQQNSILSESLSGMKIIKSFNQEQKKQAQYERQTKKIVNTRMSLLTVNVIFRPFLILLEHLGKFFVFFLSVKLLINNTITPGQAFTLFSLLSGFFYPLHMLADQFDTLQNCLSSAEKIFNILDIKSNVVDSEDARDLVNFQGNIEFRDVWFQYKEDEWVLKGVSFKASPHETVAIVGPTGAGKTTILKLIVKNYLPQRGEILLDGININNLTTKSIRSAIGQMLQDVFLFEGTIYDNLTFGNSEIPKNKVLEVLDYVGASHIIARLPQGLDTMVLERGSNFSAGERQLLSFARAILYEPEVLFLDEATANIDSESEAQIQSSLTKIMSVKTMLVVAHRLSTIKNSTKILLLSDGDIIEEGSHKELLAKKGQYYNLYKLQSKEETK